jgi:hypothetical protein
MNLRRLIFGIVGCGMFGLTGSAILAADTGALRLYESLRYATRTETRCIDVRDLSGEFWMLRDVSLQDCRLVKTSESADAAGYVLVCNGGHGTTGTATWQLGQEAIAGTLNVRLGGKNMTFYQRITAKPIGRCG